LPVIDGPEPEVHPETLRAPNAQPPRVKREMKYAQLADEVQKMRRQNSTLKSQIRDLQLKLRNSTAEEEKLREALELTRDRTL
jgi:predicted  nucleic acid-binding Zn-ribbon protein